ncbi:sigma-54-dependent Fis family transcriptional regulator [Fictibacillus sp. WQ 8-8]|uniref:sigma-54-dependent Fis family transcriptional regulator n=1 Tax=Fictibacillus sp. WQ 8-8 TaxID=2938788 RepID=UPI00210ACFEC|nr:sigma-54-dependent Fis family transcriptional regulator [Fictibacillus sp. WQ 8-8]MCQ6267781.1 sigma-54-dependent Fis family transcriptional regulator [Fictibacillus sp. WQ 8-8]
MDNPLISLNISSRPKIERVRIEKAWEHFILGKDLNFEVRSLMYQSWQRSLSHGIHPIKGNAPTLVSEEKIQEYQSTDPLYSVLEPLLTQLKNTAVDLGHLIVFCNNKGEIVYLNGAPSLKQKAEKMNFTIGSSWSELHIGTNAIGTALATGSPIQVFASEHFCQPVHNWVCSASPIRDPATQEILGVIDLTGDWSLIHPHSLSTAVFIAQSIEGILLKQLEFERYKLLEYYRETSLKTPNKTLAVIDRGGNVIKADNTFYSNGWIHSDSNHIIGLENNGRSLNEEYRLESKEKWNYEVSPYYYSGKLIGSIVQAISPTRLSSPKENTTKYSFFNLIGKSKEIQSVIVEARSIASLTLPVLIQGESGTGKELFAQAIHSSSARSSGPFIAVNCGAIQKDLAESELFGYEEGTFTGGQKGGKSGKFQQAEGGTIFLDEIGEMPLDLQTTLLRVLEEGEVVRLGGKKPIKLNVRVITATNRDLKKESEEGKFRLDLYYRLNILSIKIPPLRDRTQDIRLLLDDLLKKVCRDIGRSQLWVNDEALQFLEQYEWPGNVRELRNFAYKMAVKVTSNIITINNIPKEMMESRSTNHLVNLKEDSQDDSENKIQSLKDQELKTILTVLNESNGNVRETAEKLGIHRSTIYRKLSKISDIINTKP